NGGAPDAFAATPLHDHELLRSPQPLVLLVVHRPPLTASVMARPAISPPGVFLRVPAQPVPQRPVRVGGGVALERAAVSGPAQPGQTARHPFTHLQCSDQVRDGGTAPARAKKFPSANSFSAAFSSSASASSRFNVAFCFSSSLRRFASSALRPRYWLRHR